MHSFLTRGNALLGFTLWVMAAVTAAAFLSTVFLDYTTNVELKTSDIKIRPVVDYTTEDETVDLATLQFSISADFSKLFNWNVKQLFVYLVAEYQSKNNAINQVVLWDRIVERSERVVMNEKNLKTKYYFLDDGKNLIGHKNVTFVLRYNVIPNSGYLRLSQAQGQIEVPFPTEYSAKSR
ncbi:unnamed protein product [Caenorhabditis angaria]|uniref:Signal peptidase complex subunit 3 n=1 Tax=Caenorhabditis angaria TaxID=860376 RepID=A0A9P1IIU5_9PELO|nr:unnamed protein product [Caenorhabditis angaria]